LDLHEVSRLWREAIVLGVEDSALNAALARERLVLLFVNAFRRPGVGAFPAPGPRHLAATARR
ncbi:MAG TPA: hypothetical protein VFX38_02460, partial [Gammaproteobacteria bacterium]|nr:hypothetical protein [Gammaproteobacteria bacterium]